MRGHRLYEVRKVRQDNEPRGLKRWFTCESADLFVWSHAGHITRFEFCYNKLQDEHVLEWAVDWGYKHARIDDGEQNILQKQTPIHVRDGYFNMLDIALVFEELASGIDSKVFRFILKRLHIKTLESG